MKTIFERVLETVRNQPGLDQRQLAEGVGITVSHVSVCITQLERHNLVGHQLIEIQGSNRRHRGYFTVDGARLKRSCPDCRGEMVLYGFRGDTLIQRCNACGRRVDVPPYVPKAQKER